MRVLGKESNTESELLERALRAALMVEADFVSCHLNVEL